MAENKGSQKPAAYVPPHRRNAKKTESAPSKEEKPVSRRNVETYARKPSDVDPVDEIASKIEKITITSSGDDDRDPQQEERPLSHILEMSGFPEHYADQDIQELLEKSIKSISASEGGTAGSPLPINTEDLYRLVWPDDAHVVVVFKSAMLARAILHDNEQIGTIVLKRADNCSEKTAEIMRTVPKMFEAPTGKPQRSTVVANRLIQGALGIKSPKSKAQETEERLLREQRQRNLRRKQTSASK